MTSPLIIWLATMWSASAAYSSAVPSRLGKGTLLPRLFWTSSGSANIIGVANSPGEMVLTRTPKRASSRAAGSVIAATPPFDAAYAAWPTWPSVAATEAVLTMTPRSAPASGSRPIMSAAARRMALNVPVRLTAMTRSNQSSASGPSRPTMRFAGPTPAQLIRMRAGPCAARASATAASPLAASVTSQARPRAPISAAASRVLSASMSSSATLAPASMSASAVALPSPDAPPVTIAAWPLASMFRPP